MTVNQERNGEVIVWIMAKASQIGTVWMEAGKTGMQCDFKYLFRILLMRNVLSLLTVTGDMEINISMPDSVRRSFSSSEMSSFHR